MMTFLTTCGLFFLVLGMGMLLERWLTSRKTRTKMPVMASPKLETLLAMERASQRRKDQLAVRAAALRAAEEAEARQSREDACRDFGCSRPSQPSKTKSTTSSSTEDPLPGLQEIPNPKLRRTKRTGTLLSTGFSSALEHLETLISSGLPCSVLDHLSTRQVCYRRTRALS